MAEELLAGEVGVVGPAAFKGAVDEKRGHRGLARERFGREGAAGALSSSSSAVVLSRPELSRDATTRRSAGERRASAGVGVRMSSAIW